MGLRLPPPDRLTPMFRQWRAAKLQHPDALLLFRMGDFYELFFEDAVVAAPILDIALTTRGKGTACEAPMCGVPHHAVDSYVARLVEAGHRVAICEQVEDPRQAKGMVRREVVRVVSPGTFADPGRTAPGDEVYLASVHFRDGAPGGAALVELSTGSMMLAELRRPDDLADLIDRHGVRELLLPQSAADRGVPALPPGGARPLLTPLPDELFDPAGAADRVRRALAVASLAGLGCPDDHPALPPAAAALEHLRATQRVKPAHLDRFRVLRPERTLLVDAATRRNLELVCNLRDGGRRNTLLSVLDRTKTPMGARTLKGYLLEPSTDIEEIRRRQAIVSGLFDRSDRRRALRDALAGVRDLERLLGRASLGRATPADLAALRGSLERLPAVREALSEIDVPAVQRLAERVDSLEDLAGELASALADEPSGAPGEGRVIREGYDAELDEARELARGGRRLIAAVEERERRRTGISSLKVRYNKVFGYFIEVSKANLAKVPADYERRQTIATGERFVTPEIRDLERRILEAEERLGGREKELFDRLVEAVVGRAGRIRESAAAVAEADALASLAEVAHTEGYTRPLVDGEDRIEIEAGRHPVVENLLGAGGFVPNDTRLDSERRLLIVTGPNMGGKSTYLRQVALIVLMAQIGSFVPARSARIGVCDRIFCRVGASDNLAGGESTFMVEMLETANILHNATPRSLVILDEIGRGTATWDGMAIAWAVVEKLHDDPRLQPKALFATHYHELTDLATLLPRLANVHIAAREHGHEIVLLHRVEPGPSDRSYGIQVARLAGLPDDVVRRAREILERLTEEKTSAAEAIERAAGRRPSPQLPLFGAPTQDPAEREVLEELRRTDPDDLSPREAHALLAKLSDRLRRGPVP
ncbi:MAG: DNA mismatch repair protein MutS [Acidobacteria bacterium]|nr:MAG: DNA mismatch repair protein MutS [Acidobacteriota bacterium]